MADKLYTISDIARMTFMSDRTIRTYIKDGRLTGRKVNGKWRFTPEEVGRFMDDPYVTQGLQIKNNALIYDFLRQSRKTNAEACAICDIPADGPEKAGFILDRINPLMNTGQYGSVTMSYNYEIKNRTVRLILTGSPVQVAEVMRRFGYEV